jgi:hypothetical protein
MTARPDPVSEIDDMLESILSRPSMHGASDVYTLEALVLNFLNLRRLWEPHPEDQLFHSVLQRWKKEHFQLQHPGSASPATLLLETLEWNSEVSHDAPQNRSSWRRAVSFYHELVRREKLEARKHLRQKEQRRQEGPCDPEVLHDLIGLVVGPEEFVPTGTSLWALTPEERLEIERWAVACHAEASDNDVEAGPCPKALRDLLPEDHYLHTWRVAR